MIYLDETFDVDIANLTDFWATPEKVQKQTSSCKAVKVELSTPFQISRRC